MYKNLLEKETQEYWGNHANRVYIVLLIAISSVFIPLFSHKNFMVVVPILCTGYITQLCPLVFAAEKEGNTFETLIALPLSMKKIFYTKVLWLFLTELLLFFSILVLGGGVILMKVGFSSSFLLETGIYNVIIGILLAPWALWNLSYHATLISIKAVDTRSCALSATFMSIIYGILIVTLYVTVQLNLGIALNLAIAIFYLVINFVLYIVLNKIGKKYFSKTYCCMLCKKDD